MPMRAPGSVTACSLLALGVAVLPATAAADEVYGTRAGEQMSEQGHTIELRFDRGHAELEVRRTVYNGIDRHDQAMFWLDLPSVAVATGLRTLGERDGKPHWYAGELLEAEAAAARYEELTGVGGFYPKDPALLSWRHQGFLALQVFPVAPQSEKTVEYTLDMPAVWEGGRWHLELPSFGSEALAADIRVHPANPLDQLFVDGEVVSRGHFLLGDRGYAVALAPRDPARMELSLASVPTGARHLAQWQVTLAPRLSTIPRAAKLVVVLDLSRSQGPEAIESQRNLALAYLEHFRAAELGAEVALLGFDHEVHSLTPGFVSADQAYGLLIGAPLATRNGSELGDALAEATRLLAGERSRGPERIVLLSDFETRARLSPAQVSAATAFGDALVHFVDIEDEGAPALARADAHAWAGLPAATGGVAWRGSGPSVHNDPGVEAEARAVFEELARPVRVDEVEVRVAGLSFALDGYRSEDTLGALGSLGSLAEGEGIQALELSATAARELTFDGLLWNQPVHERSGPSRAAGDRWSALVFGSELVGELSEDEMMTLAMRGHAVSPVTSYLAIEPGVRPSTEGLLASEIGGGMGFGSAGGFATGVTMQGAGSAPQPDRQGWLEAELGAGWRRCAGAGAQAELELETRSTELLGFELRSSPADASARACMEQVVWSVDLPSYFSDYATWTLSL